MTTTISGKTQELLSIFERLALPFGGDVLINPLKLLFTGDGETMRMNVDAKSPLSTTFIRASFKVARNGENGSVIVDAKELIKLLKLHPADADCSIEFGNPILITTPKKKSTIFPEALEPAALEKFPQFDGKIVSWKDGTVPSDTIAETTAEGLASVISDAKAIEVGEFPVEIIPQGIRLQLGANQAKHVVQEDMVEAKVTGPAVAHVIGADYVHLFSNLTGPVILQTKEGFALAVIVDRPNSRIVYVLSPRRPSE